VQLISRCVIVYRGGDCRRRRQALATGGGCGCLKIKCAQSLTEVADIRMLAAAAAFDRQGEHKIMKTLIERGRWRRHAMKALLDLCGMAWSSKFPYATRSQGRTVTRLLHAIPAALSVALVAGDAQADMLAGSFSGVVFATPTRQFFDLGNFFGLGANANLSGLPISGTFSYNPAGATTQVCSPGGASECTNSCRQA
jgi:hypothetical protein